jgi:hypothetical protein
MSGTRRYPRYPISLRLRLQLPSGELETTTEEISLAGFSAKCASLPEEGTEFPFVIHLPDEKLISGTAAAVRISSGGLAGFSCQFAAELLPLWSAFVQQEHAQGGVWRMIGRWVGNTGDADATRAVREKGSTGALRLHMVGENGEAYRIAFEKHPSEKPEASSFARASPRMLEFARRAIARILTQDVQIKPSPQASIESLRLVQMLNGGYSYVVDSGGGKPGLMGLHGSELIVIEADGKSVFPFFDEADLQRIASDTFRREPIEPKAAAAAASAPAPMIQDERFASNYEHQQVDTNRPVAITVGELVIAIGASQRAQTRTYGGHTVRLFPDVWLEVQRAVSPQPVRGFAMQDGAALCLFVLVGEGAPRVVKLEPNDQIFSIRGGPAGG